MKFNELLKKNKNKKVTPSKPRNFVAKNAMATTSGAGAHKDKKKAMKQGDIKHKNKEFAEGLSTRLAEAVEQSKIGQLEQTLAKLEKMTPMIEKISKENHYVFEQIESEVTDIYNELEALGDSSEAIDLKDTVDEAINHIRRANGAVYTIENTVKNLIRTVNYSIDDLRDEENFESRFGVSND